MAQPEYKSWYKTARWQKHRARHLALNPLCVMCAKENRVTAARVADHTVPHRGDEALFWDFDNLQPLCFTHHNSDAQRAERGGRYRRQVGVDGWPVELSPEIAESERLKRTSR